MKTGEAADLGACRFDRALFPAADRIRSASDGRRARDLVNQRPPHHLGLADLRPRRQLDRKVIDLLASDGQRR
jgi:hypothetical protein